MKDLVKCTINGELVVVTDNSVKTNNKNLQIELVKRLIECREIAGAYKSALPLFINKYLRFYPIENLEICTVKPQKSNNLRLIAA